MSLKITKKVEKLTKKINVSMREVSFWGREGIRSISIHRMIIFSLFVLNVLCVLCLYYVAAAEGRMQRVFGCFLIVGQETVVAVHRSSAKQIQPYYTNTKHAGKASKIFYQFGVLTLAQIIWSTRRLVKVLLGI